MIKKEFSRQLAGGKGGNPTKETLSGLHHISQQKLYRLGESGMIYSKY